MPASFGTAESFSGVHIVADFSRPPARESVRTYLPRDFELLIAFTPKGIVAEEILDRGQVRNADQENVRTFPEPLVHTAEEPGALQER
jgi:hypothetical protein